MKNPPFIYHRPETLQEALALLAEHGDEAKVLAGGQSLLPVMALRLGRPEHIVDIGRISGLDAIWAGADGVTLGALVRHAQAERSDDIAQWAPLVHSAMPHIGHRAIRSQGTVCGSIAHADPAAEMPAVCLATGAVMVAASANGSQREIAAADFGQGYLTTALEAHELLIEIRFPHWPPGAGGTVVELSRRHGDYALVGLACIVDVQDGVIAEASLSFFGVANTPVRIAEAEASLVGRAPDEEAFAAAAHIVSATIEPSSDVHATASYRRHIAGVLTRRGLAEATAKIGATV